MALHVFVFVFLLVVCLLFSLTLLWRLDWFHRRPSSSRGEVKRSTVQRLLKPRCPDDCPACRLSSTPSLGGGPGPAPVRPWREVKSRRGAPKRIPTEGFACPNPKCPYLGITDAHIHALVVLPWDMVENLISLCKSLSSSYFHQYAVQAGYLLLKESPFRRLLHAFSSTFPRDAPAPASCLRGLKRKRTARGKRAPRVPSIVDGFCPLPWLGCAVGSVAPDGCLLVLVSSQALSAARHGAHKMVVGAPPLQMGQQGWRLLSRRPAPTSQRSYSVSDGQIHPLNKGGVEPS